MRKPDALFMAMAAATTAFAIAFVYPMLGSQPVPWYYPLERRWAFQIKPSGLAMDFYGRVLVATITWSVVFMVTLPIVRRVGSGTRIIGLTAAWTVTIVVLVMLYFAWMLYFRVPEPATVPSWYQPR